MLILYKTKSSPSTKGRGDSRYHPYSKHSLCTLSHWRSITFCLTPAAFRRKLLCWNSSLLLTRMLTAGDTLSLWKVMQTLLTHIHRHYVMMITYIKVICQGFISLNTLLFLTTVQFYSMIIHINHTKGELLWIYMTENLHGWLK